jgi:hypothetical protein
MPAAAPASSSGAIERLLITGYGAEAAVWPALSVWMQLKVSYALCYRRRENGAGHRLRVDSFGKIARRPAAWLMLSRAGRDDSDLPSDKQNRYCKKTFAG